MLSPINRPLKNYLRCRCGVKNKLKMLIYYAKTSLFRLFLPCIGCLENVFQQPVKGISRCSLIQDKQPPKSPPLIPAGVTSKNDPRPSDNLIGFSSTDNRFPLKYSKSSNLMVCNRFSGNFRNIRGIPIVLQVLWKR